MDVMVRVDGFDEFFAMHYRGVVTALEFAVLDRTVAEDAAQEAFVRALRRWRTVVHTDRPAAWVYVVAMREARRQLSRRKRQPRETEKSDAIDIAVAVTEGMPLRDALAGLPPRQRQAVTLRFLADLPVADIARAMGCKQGTVKSTLHAALTSLRVELADSEGEL
jgi:RNA polymerase sigma-70 factor (ECF subfamily)